MFLTWGLTWFHIGSAEVSNVETCIAMHVVDIKAISLELFHEKHFISEVLISEFNTCQ
jgi:hypothetical protein